MVADHERPLRSGAENGQGIEQMARIGFDVGRLVPGQDDLHVAAGVREDPVHGLATIAGDDAAPHPATGKHGQGRPGLGKELRPAGGLDLHGAHAVRHRVKEGPGRVGIPHGLGQGSGVFQGRQPVGRRHRIEMGGGQGGHAPFHGREIEDQFGQGSVKIENSGFKTARCRVHAVPPLVHCPERRLRVWSLDFSARADSPGLPRGAGAGAAATVMTQHTHDRNA